MGGRNSVERPSCNKNKRPRAIHDKPNARNGLGESVMSSILLTAAGRQNVLELQRIDKLIGQAEQRLASGKKVARPSDNPAAFFDASICSGNSDCSASDACTSRTPTASNVPFTFRPAASLAVYAKVGMNVRRLVDER